MAVFTSFYEVYACRVIKLGLLDRTKLHSFIKFMHTNCYSLCGGNRLFMYISLADY